MAVEATIRGAIKAIKAKKPGNLYNSLMYGDGKLKYPTPGELKRMTKMRSHTWQVKAQRYLQI
jgi:hypothetical protein